MTDGRSLPGLAPLLWIVLAAALIGVIVAGVLGLREPSPGPPAPAAPPILGEVPAFELVADDGAAVTLDDLHGTPWVANLIFTRCRLSCPLLTERMEGLARRLPERVEARLVSVSVDPAHDTPEVLAAYAAEYRVAGREWLFLTGEVDAVLALARDGFRLGVDLDPPAEQASPEEPILHSTRMVLVDAEGRIRGYYDAFEPGQLDRLSRDLEVLGAGR